MMTKEKIEYDGKVYEFKEPTLEMYANIMKYKDRLNYEELYLMVIEELTGLSEEEILNANADLINQLWETITKFINMNGKELFQVIEHKNKKYNLVDVYKISFGQFVDIDTFLSKDEKYRIENLNELAAYLYCDDGMNYGNSDFSKRIEEFKDLPLKYVEGAIFFLLSLGLGLHQLTQLYSKSKIMWWIMKMQIHLVSIGDGMQQFLHLPKTKFGFLIMLLLSPLWVVLTTFHISWIKIKKWRKKRKNRKIKQSSKNE